MRTSCPKSTESPHVRDQGGRPCLVEDQQNEVENHPLVIWTRLAPGNVVLLRAPDIGDRIGMVESKTSDGLIIWIRDSLNERKLFHFHDCRSFQLLR